MSWERSAVPERDGALGLLDMDPSGALPKGATVIDVLAWALSLPGSEDVITGMVDAVSLELATLAGVVPERRIADVLLMLGRRLDAASLLLKWSDNRERMPTGEEPPVVDEPESPPEEPAPRARKRRQRR